MKRPIAELLSVHLHEDGVATHTRLAHETWQILRRKQGYVTHRVYEQVDQPLQRLVYSEWDSKKALDGARQHLQATPLNRQVRATFAAAPQRIVVELVGPVTSTKGLHLPDGAVAATALCHLDEGAARWQEQQAPLWHTLSQQPGHISHVLFRGFDDLTLVGSFSHWVDAASLDRVLAGVEANGVPGLGKGLNYVQYRPLRELRPVA